MTPLERATKAAGDAITESTKGLLLHPETCVAAVRAALATLMEPGVEIEDIGTTEFHRVYLSAPIARNVWQAMLKKVIE